MLNQIQRRGQFQQLLNAFWDYSDTRELYMDGEITIQTVDNRADALMHCLDVYLDGHLANVADLGKTAHNIKND